MDIAVIMAAAAICSCTASPKYRSGGVSDAASTLYSSKFFQKGIASYYGSDFNGKRTASGEIYDMNGMSAAHRTLPFDTILEVTNLDNDRKILVRVNDRGPFVQGRIIDLSVGAAKELGMFLTGTAEVELRVRKWGDSRK